MMITRITDENVSYFKAVIPDRLYARSNTALGAIDDEGKACGVLLADIGAQEAELLWLFVDEKHRGEGFGELLMSTFTDIADKAGVRLSFFTMIETRNEEEFVDFLDSKTGFVREFDNKGTLYSFRLSDVKVGSAVNTGVPGIKPLSDALSREERKVRERVKKLFGVQVSDADMEDWKSSGLSYVKTVDNETDAFVLAKFVEDEGAYERISVDYIYSSEQGMRSLLPIVGVMRSQTKALGLPPNTKVQAVALTNTIVGVINEVTDGKYTGEGKLTVWTRRK